MPTRVLWSGERGSNPQHLAWKASTLPIELSPHKTHPQTLDTLLLKQRQDLLASPLIPDEVATL